jgi:hypothetical protein
MGFDATADIFRHPAVIVWGLLVAATVTSGWLGLHHGVSSTTVTVAGTFILVITFVKIHLVGMYFMEVRHAPKFLVGLFATWTVATCAVTIGFYIFAVRVRLELQRSTDDDLHDFIGASIDFLNSRISIHPGNRVLVDVAITAM